MEKERIAEWRQAFYDELVKQSEGAQLNMTREDTLAEFRRVAFDSPDSDIEAFINYPMTPAEAAREELQ